MEHNKLGESKISAGAKIVLTSVINKVYTASRIEYQNGELWV